METWGALEIDDHSHLIKLFIWNEKNIYYDYLQENL